MPVPPSFPPWRTLLFGWVGLVVMSMLAFGPALDGARLWDDPAHLTRPELQSWSGLARIWFDLGATQQYYPVLHSAFWLEHRLWGEWLWGYHAVNILQHATAGWLLALFLCGLAGWRGRAWAAAAVFVAHPVAVESVAWITEQKNTLSLLWALGAAVAWLRYVSSRSLRHGICAAVLFLLALGTKSVTATLPAALLVLHGWRGGAVELRSVYGRLLPGLGVGAAAGLFTAWVERTLIGAQGEAFSLSLLERTLLASRSLTFYVGQWLLPTDLAFFYRLWDVSREASFWWPYLAAVVLVTAALAWLARRECGPLAVWLVYAGTLFPALGFVNVFPFQFSYVADHFQYHAMPALAAGAAGLAGWLARILVARRVSVPRWAGMAALAMWLIPAVYLSRGYSRQYQDNETLFQANLERVPDNWMAHNILAVALSRDPARIDEAIVHFREAVRLRPQSPDVHMGLAEALARRPEGREEAVVLYRRAVQLRPHFVEARLNLGLLLSDAPATRSEARTHLEETIRLAPELANARLALAKLLVRDPLTRQEAEPVLKALLARGGNDPDAHHLLANLYMASPSRRPEALGHYAKAIDAGGSRAELFLDYGQALALDPTQWRESARMMQRAAELRPTDADTRNLIGILFAQNGDLGTARAWWEEAQRVQPGHRASLDNLRRLGVR